MKKQAKVKVGKSGVKTKGGWRPLRVAPSPGLAGLRVAGRVLRCVPERESLRQERIALLVDLFWGATLDASSETTGLLSP